MTITGATSLVLAMADPVVHLRIPQLMNALFETQGVDAVMVPMRVPADHLAEAFGLVRATPNILGMTTAIPHKVPAAGLCDRLRPQAARIGAINAVRRHADGSLEGELCDGIGFVAGLLQAGHDPRGRSVLLAGAGGGGMAIAFALADAGITSLSVSNRTLSKAEALAERINEYFPGLAKSTASTNVAGMDMAINATALGLNADDPLSLDLADADPQLLVCDIVMKDTPLLAAAERQGLQTHPGVHMLDGQLSAIADFIAG